MSKYLGGCEEFNDVYGETECCSSCHEEFEAYDLETPRGHYDVCSCFMEERANKILKEVQTDRLTL